MNADVFSWPVPVDPVGLPPGVVLTIPALLLLGVLVVALDRWRQAHHRRRLWRQQRDLATLGAMTWQQFEALTGETFRQLGYRVRRRGGRRADGGVDLLLERQGKRYTVQCKHWVRGCVGVAIVREAVGVALHEGAAGAYVVTVRGFTAAAQTFAHGKPVHLIDGTRLLAMITESRKDAR